MLTFEPATATDAGSLTEVCTRSFNDAHRSHYLTDGGPPGYNDVNWHLKAVQDGGYYKIMDEGQIVGARRVLLRDGNECHLSPIYLDPDAQNRGIGRQAMAFLESAYPDARIWTLDTPEWAERNRHFYE